MWSTIRPGLVLDLMYKTSVLYMGKRLLVHQQEALISSGKMTKVWERLKALTKEWGRLKASFCSHTLKDVAALIREKGH